MLALYILGVFAFVCSLLVAFGLFFERRIPPLLGIFPLVLPLLWVSGCALYSATEVFVGAETHPVDVWMYGFTETLLHGNQGMAEVEWATLPAVLLFSLACGLQGLLRSPKNWGLFWTANVFLVILICLSIAHPLWSGSVGVETLITTGLLVMIGAATACAFLGAGRDSAAPEAAATAGLAFAIAVASIFVAETGEGLERTLLAVKMAEGEHQITVFHAGWSAISQLRITGVLSLLFVTILGGIGLGALGPCGPVRRFGFAFGALWLMVGPFAYFSLPAPQIFSRASSVVHQRAFADVYAGLKLPGVMADLPARVGTPLVITDSVIRFHGAEVGTLPWTDEAALDEASKALGERLSAAHSNRGKAFSGRLVVQVDASTPFSVLRKALAVVRSNGFTRIELLVDGGMVLPVELTDVEQERERDQSRPGLQVGVSENGLKLNSSRIFPCQGPCVQMTAFDFKGLKTAVDAQVAAGVGRQDLALFPDASVSYEVVVATIAVLRDERAGPDSPWVRLGL